MLSLYVKAVVGFSALRGRITERAHDDRGLETVEYVLIAVAIAVVGFLAYQALGGVISKFIRDTLCPDISGSHC
jgi:Flp pilus assembly pilin Flp